MQVEGMFDMSATAKAERSWSLELPLDEQPWSIGAFIGPSGSGKSTLMVEAFGAPRQLEWRSDRAVVDEFDPELSVFDVTGALSSVGFSSPPAWLRPFETLSNGERFRAEMARVLLETGQDEIAVVDEFTSVVDRTVAQIASHAVAKYVRKAGQQLVVASCHFDIVDWLQPDWIYDTGAGAFTWRSLQRRPAVQLDVYRSTTAAWQWFRHHHYLSSTLAPGAQCFVALVEGLPAGFIGVLPMPGRVGMRRASRAVVMPDFQGIGLGNWMIGYIGSLYRAQGYRYTATMSHPAFIRSLARSHDWRMIRAPGQVAAPGRTSKLGRGKYATSRNRFTASFEFVGEPGDVEHAAALQIVERIPSR
jgi:GNAT superfamily N-acetyltransferase